jgi:hypothetical protein
MPQTVLFNALLELDLLTLRVALRAVRNGLPIAQALEMLEGTLDGQEDAGQTLQWLLEEALKEQPEEA